MIQRLSCALAVLLLMAGCAQVSPPPVATSCYHLNSEVETAIGYCEAVQDFFAETEDRILMLEAKMATQMHDKDVLAKRDVAVQWCGWASEHARSCGEKPWQYALIPHDAIAENMTLAFLLQQYS